MRSKFGIIDLIVIAIIILILVDSYGSTLANDYNKVIYAQYTVYANTYIDTVKVSENDKISKLKKGSNYYVSICDLNVEEKYKKSPSSKEWICDKSYISIHSEEDGIHYEIQLLDSGNYGFPNIYQSIMTNDILKHYDDISGFKSIPTNLDDIFEDEK